MKSILLKLKDKDFFKLLHIKNKIMYSVEKSITWEEFMMLIITKKEVKQSKWKQIKQT